MELVLGGRVEWQAREYAGAADLSGAWLVHTAAGDSSWIVRWREMPRTSGSGASTRPMPPPPPPASRPART